MPNNLFKLPIELLVVHGLSHQNLRSCVSFEHAKAEVHAQYPALPGGGARTSRQDPHPNTKKYALVGAGMGA